MATLKKRGDRYSVIYYYNESGQRKQKWESFDTFTQAKKRKIEIESEMDKGIFIPPSSTTVTEFLSEFVEIYGATEWSITTYGKNMSIIRNYIIPYIGNTKLQDISPLMIEKYYIKLRNSESVQPPNRLYKKEKISDYTILLIHKLLKTAFKQAVMWDKMGSNPLDKVKTPKHEYKKREIWSADQIVTALKACQDSKLALAIHLSFACSLRIGEVLGLTWDCVCITDEAIENDDAYVYIEKQLEIVDIESLERLNQKDVIKVFPYNEGVHSTLVLKTPKTKTSVRKIWLPETLAILLRDWKEEQQQYKDFFKDEYQDNNLVVCLENGRPCSTGVIRTSLDRLIIETGLPKIVFHSFRHASTTYKLKLNHGDIKATQGDTGHAQADMVMDVYSHIIDEDRKINAQKFETSFYTEGGTLDRKNKKIDIDKLINSMKENPEVLEKIANLLEDKQSC